MDGKIERRPVECGALTRRRMIAGLGGATLSLVAGSAAAQFGFNFGSSESGSPFSGLNLDNLISGVQSLFEGLSMGEEEEIRLGETLYPRFIDQMGGPYRNNRLQLSLRNFAEALFKTSDRSKLPWEVTLLNDNTVNAWALPGGKVGVNKGLLRYAATETQLAAVLGHEMGHVELSHGLGQMRSESFTKGLSSLGREAIATQIGSERVLTDRLIDALEAPLLKMVTTGYSRESEFEADLHLLKTFGKTGHNPAQAADFFKVLLELMPPDGEETTSLFSTHPGTRERIERIDAAASGMPTGAQKAADASFVTLKRTFPTRQHFRRQG